MIFILLITNTLLMFLVLLINRGNRVKNRLKIKDMSLPTPVKAGAVAVLEEIFNRLPFLLKYQSIRQITKV